MAAGWSFVVLCMAVAGELAERAESRERHLEDEAR